MMESQAWHSIAKALTSKTYISISISISISVSISISISISTSISISIFIFIPIYIYSYIYIYLMGHWAHWRCRLWLDPACFGMVRGLMGQWDGDP